jgi:lipopolysaccharide biosynthesis glycosyltransferase
MDVFYASDDGYAQHLCVSMASVLRHAQWPVRFHVLDGGISESNKAVITKHVKKFPHSEIEFIVVDNDFWLVSRICGDTQVPVTCQVHDITQFPSTSAS